MKNTSESHYRDIKLEHFIGVLLKYVPEDRVRNILTDLGVSIDNLDEVIERVKSEIPKRAPVTHRDPVLRREYEKMYLTLSSLREYVSSLDRRITALERAVERILDQLSMLELSKES